MEESNMTSRLGDQENGVDNSVIWLDGDEMTGGVKIKSSIWDMLKLRCLRDTQVEISNQ